MRLPLAALLPQDVCERIGLQPSYRAKQLVTWIQKGAHSYAQMSDLPASLRASLEQRTLIASSRLQNSCKDTDGTVKLSLELFDGHVVEAVLLTDRSGRRTACLSTQVGCAMGCLFCRTGQSYARDCQDYEIVEQLLTIVRRHGAVTNIVFMGMGEPLENTNNLRRAVHVFNWPQGLGIGLRRMTVSSCGVVAGIRDLAAHGPHVRLALSLITADATMRKELMPAAKKHGLTDIKAALLEYQQASGMRVTLEIVLMEGLTDRDKDVAALLDFISPLKVVVNLIPWNAVPGLPFRQSRPAAVRRFRERLRQHSIPVTQRYRRGLRVEGACGQLGFRERRSNASYIGR